MLRRDWIPVITLAGVLAGACAAGPGTSQHGDDPALEPPLASRDAASDEVSPAVQDPEPSHAFPREEAKSFFVSTTARKALELFRRHEFTEALALVARAHEQSRSEEEQGALQILRARVFRELGRWNDAGELFASAIETYPEIADYLHYEAARAFGMARDPRASRHASQVEPSGPWGAEREFLLAEAARAEGDVERAAQQYRKFLMSVDESVLRSEARYRLGEMLEARGDSAAARAEWRELLVSDPTSAWAEDLRKKDETLDARLSKSELLTRGMALFHAMRNPEAEADLAAVLKKSPSPEERCLASFHRAKSILKERDYKRAAPQFVPAIKACKAAGNTNYEVKSAYQAGIAYGRLRKYALSAKYFRYIERYPKHSYADDARLRQAEQFEELGKDAKVTALLAAIPKRYPEGDMRAEALWRLARRAYFKKDYAEAAKWLEEQIRVAPIETNWWAEGQAHYWLGRSLARQGKTEEAAKAYRDCIRIYPLTYYSLQAFARLEEAFPDAHAAALEEVANQPSSWNGELRDRALYATPRFRGALMLARLGIGDATRRELTFLGMGIPEGREASSEPDAIDRLLATATILDLAGDYAHSHWPGRWHAVDYRRSWPTGANFERWRLAYPLAYWELLREFANKYTYPAHLQMAIVREESAFDPARESWANAIGLTQMIFPTAIDHSKGTDIKVTRENLQHPVKNVTIGSHFLQSLQDAFEGRVGLMVPGYNAGRARVRGWIRGRKGRDLDEFIELIPGDQARRYTKRVLGSYFAYSYLDSKQVPSIRNAVPFKLGNL